MGSVVAEVYLDMPRPRVGLLNIGEEPGKGRDLEKATYELLETAPIEFIGNVEGRDLAADRADVFVTDGFTGNVVLKTTEGAVQLLVQMLMGALSELPPEDLRTVMPTLREVQRRVDHEEYGGAHLVGTDGVVVIAHGSSSRVAIANAVAMAAEGADRNLVRLIAERLSP
jgi:glycerol-3-phosphate acyltransferase PlsX